MVAGMISIALHNRLSRPNRMANLSSYISAMILSKALAPARIIVNDVKQLQIPDDDLSWAVTVSTPK